MTVAGVSIDLADLQGDILRAYGNAYAHTAYVFFRVDDAGAGRAWLRGLLPRVTTAEPWSAGKPQTTLNLAVTAAGLQRARRARRRARHLLARVPRRDGRARARRWATPARATRPTGSPSCTARPHVLATVNALDDGALGARDHAPAQRRRERRRRRCRPTSSTPSCCPARASTSATPTASPSRRSPASTTRPTGASAAASPRPRAPGARWRPASSSSATRTRTRASIPSARLPSAPADPFGRTGTYMVWRKLHQDVALFRHVLREAAALYRDGDHEKLAAKVVGRWPNGTPLVISPDAPIPDFDAQGRRAPTTSATPPTIADGRRCPLGAHIRRTNPRDALGFDGLLSFRHRIIRRGMPYGRAAARRGDRGRPRRPRPGLRLLQREHLAPVRGHPGAVAQRRQHLRTSATTATSCWATRRRRAR